MKKGKKNDHNLLLALCISKVCTEQLCCLHHTIPLPFYIGLHFSKGIFAEGAGILDQFRRCARVYGLSGMAGMCRMWQPHSGPLPSVSWCRAAPLARLAAALARDSSIVCCSESGRYRSPSSNGTLYRPRRQLSSNFAARQTLVSRCATERLTWIRLS